MWWAPLAAACVFGLVIVALYLVQQRRQRGGAKTYRARYIQLVAQLDTMTRTVNEIGLYASSVRDPRLLDYYESTLRVLETLLSAVGKIPPFGSHPSVLDSAFFLVRDCRERVGRIHQAFRDILRGRPLKLDKLYGREESPMNGCYFCSRPLVTSRFTKVRVRIDGSVKEVVSCKICREELESTKKVKVLYFMKEGRPVHWSKVSDYQPSEDYWNINKRRPVHRTPKLELVYSRPEKTFDNETIH